ncbi:MAG: hypothetical protein SFX18_12630 [Pirellulales bacterium]|nr:hypothetical protein [Pirellulales bacterium]
MANTATKTEDRYAGGYRFWLWQIPPKSPFNSGTNLKKIDGSR